MKLAKRGAAMLAALLFLVVASGIITLMFTSTLSEIRHSGDDVAIVQALTLARGGANLGAQLLQDKVRDELEILTLEKADTVKRFPFGTGPDPTAPEPEANYVIRDLERVTTALQKEIDGMLCGGAGTLSLARASQRVSVRIYVTPKACKDSDALPDGIDLPKGVKLPAVRYVSGQTRTYSLPFVLVSEATVGQNYKRVIASQGEYQFTLGGGKFSQFARFTDENIGPDKDTGAEGPPIWFTNQTNYDGRVHTNGHFNIGFEPWFGAKVTSAGCTERVDVRDEDGKLTTECKTYNPGVNFLQDSPILTPANAIGDPPQSFQGGDKPQFEQGVDWEATYIALPEDNLGLDGRADLVFGNLESLTLYAGDASGAPLSRDGDGWTPASHQYIEVCKTASPCELYRYAEDEKLYKQDSDGSWSEPPVVEEFNGLIYIDGKVERFKGPDRLPPTPPETTSPADTPPALASFATLTVVPTGDIRITGDIKYEDPPCAGVLSRDENGIITRSSCDNLRATNVLGVFTPEGNILVGNQNEDETTNAPHDLEIHGSFMAAKGVFMAENYKADLRGDINLLGGIIEKKHGIVGAFGGEKGEKTSGYGISATFDQRMATEYSSPYFPGTGPSDVQDVFIYSFGQREQVF